MIKITIPYDPGMSKNKKFVAYRSKVLAQPYRDAKKAIFWKLSSLKSSKLFKPETKTYVLIYVYRPHFRADMQNFEECICDAIKDAIPVGDNYYSLAIDYELDKKNPRIEIQVRQQDERTEKLFREIFCISDEQSRSD